MLQDISDYTKPLEQQNFKCHFCAYFRFISFAQEKLLAPIALLNSFSS